VRDRKEWPLAFRDFIAEHMTVTVEDVAVCALRAPGGFPVEADVSEWITQSLAAMRWRQGKGSIWRKPAKA
jgi:hypothetical protein